MELLDPLRRAKHAAFVGRKRVRLGYRKGKFAIATRAFKHADAVRPYRYDERRYRRGPHAQEWLAHHVSPGGASVFPRRVFAIWSGDNPLSAARERNVELLRQRLEVELVLVTPANLDQWLVEGFPLHPAYEALSLVHRSDYLRGYLMHHHGGGYVDIKEPLHSWAASFEEMSAVPECWVTSYPTTDANWVAKLRGPIGRDILVRHTRMFGKGSLLMRSHTPLTAEWVAEMDRRLDGLTNLLVREGPQDPFGGSGYPVSWNDLLARVLDPLTLKYLDHVRHDSRLLLRFEDYR